MTWSAKKELIQALIYTILPPLEILISQLVGNTDCYLQTILGPNSEEAIDKKE